MANPQFKDIDLQRAALDWTGYAAVDGEVRAVWFEADDRNDLLSPSRYFAFHASISNETFSSYGFEKFARAHANVADVQSQQLLWPYAPTWPAEGRASESD